MNGFFIYELHEFLQRKNLANFENLMKVVVQTI